MWVELLWWWGAVRHTVRESPIGLLGPAPTSLCGGKILPCSKVIGGITSNLTVTAVAC